MVSKAKYKSVHGKRCKILTLNMVGFLGVCFVVLEEIKPFSTIPP